MTKNKILLAFFILIALLQLYVPAKIILDREVILNEGKEFKFKTEPIDPNDPFRGKYITLSFAQEVIRVSNEEDWQSGETIYVLLTKDEEGFSKIQSATKVRPGKNHDFLKTKVRYVSRNGAHTLTIHYPFDRYYMEESKAYDAELTYRTSRVDSNQVAWARVFIKSGEAVLQDVLVNGLSIKEIIKKERENATN